MDTELYAQYEQSLVIDKLDLDVELMSQAGLFHKVASEWAIAESRRDKLASELKELYYDLDTTTREMIEVSGNKKPTEGAIEAMVKSNPRYISLNHRYLAAVSEAQRWSVLKDSFHQRSFMLRDLVQLYMSEYFTKEVIEGDSARGDAVKAEIGRSTMAENRKPIAPRRRPQ